MRQSPMLSFMLSALALARISDAHACADGFGCAVVKQTPDGFVSLRHSASSSSSAVGRLKPYEILIVEVGDCENGAWVPVVAVPRLAGFSTSGNPHGTSGWVNRRFIEETTCPIDPN
jgi:hypothetical protein